MQIRDEEDGWAFEEIDSFIADLLRAIPDCATVEDEAARQRIFTPLTAGQDPAADEDWREYVEPDLRELFKSHTDIVGADLATMQRHGKVHSLRIPLANARAWIHTLNQARLAIGARHAVTEEDTAGRNEITGEKGFAIMQIDFYAMLLSLFLSRTEL